jgi:uncharacterized protein YegP (UPF0339 family)
VAGKFEVYKDNKGEYRFRLKGANGQNIFASQGYSSQKACTNGVASVQRNAALAEQYERKQAQNGKHYFVLKAKNSQIIGQSQMYESAAAMETGIKSVMKNGPTDQVDDLTA